MLTSALVRLRKQINITLAFVCQLLLSTPLFASQTPAAENAANTASNEIKIFAKQQSEQGHIVTLAGEAEIDFRQYRFTADQITYDTDTGNASAKGHLQLAGGPENLLIKASHGDYNLKTESGHLYNIIGTVGMHYRGGDTVLLTSANPFAFTGKEVDKLGKDHYILHDGMVTSCHLPNPKWSLRSGKIDFTVDGEAKMYNARFRIKDIPIIYLPFAEHPVEELGRHTGFLVPTAGVSTVKGDIVGDSFYWAIGRSSDATLGAEYFSNRGFAQHGDLRARPSEDSEATVTYFGVLDRGTFTTNPGTGQYGFLNEGGEDIKATALGRLPHGFSGAINAEYLSSYLFRLAFAESYTQAVNSEVKSIGFVTKAYDGFDFSSFVARYQNFQSDLPGDVISILHAPSFDLTSVDRPLLGSAMWGFDASLESLSRREPGLRTASSVPRVDVHPHVRVPLFFRGWTIAAEAGARDTFYSQQLTPNAVGVLQSGAGSFGVVSSALDRRTFDASFELRPPTLERVFDRPLFGRKIKHTIEPRIEYHYVTGVSDFNRILRFDYRDIISDTDNIEYAITNRFYTRRVHERQCTEAELAEIHAREKLQKLPLTHSCGANARELLSWEIAQQHYFDPTFGGAVIAGIRNVFQTSEDLTGIAFITAPRDLSPVISRLRYNSSDNTQIEWDFDYDTIAETATSSNVIFDYHLNNWLLGAGQTLLRTPGEVITTNPLVNSPIDFDQYRFLAGYGAPNKRGLSIAGTVGFDTVQSQLQYSSFQSSYNWDCCGLTLEYRRFSLGAVRDENVFRFAFTLANIGTFGNIKRQERLY